MTIDILSQKTRRKLDKFDVDMPYVQSRIHPADDSAESITDSDLEGEELRKMLASPLYAHGRGENDGSSQKPSRQSHERLGNRMQCFHEGATNREASSKVLCSRLLIRQNWEHLFLKAIKVTAQSGKI